MTAHLVAFLAFASLAPSLAPQCKEWRTLLPPGKMSHLNAVDCIATTTIPHAPSSNNSGVKSRNDDDLLCTHIQQTFSIHYVGDSLPWHRYYSVATYEHILRAECGYDGAQPYQDWTLDVGSDETFVNSPVHDTGLGFGGNGDALHLA